MNESSSRIKRSYFIRPCKSLICQDLTRTYHKILLQRFGSFEINNTTMAKKKKLQAGVGAEANIITRYIDPKQPATNDKKNQSDVILIGRYEDEKQKYVIFFI
jgi:hypothetical protein